MSEYTCQTRFSNITNSYNWRTYTDAVENHLLVCSACRELHAGVQEFIATLRASKGNPVSPSDSFTLPFSNQPFPATGVSHRHPPTSNAGNIYRQFT